MPELKGGVPNLSPSIGVDFVKNFSNHIFIDTGSQNFSKRGHILSYGEDSKVKFNGKDAWKSPVIINGSLEFLVKPFSSNSYVEIFLR